MEIDWKKKDKWIDSADGDWEYLVQPEFSLNPEEQAVVGRILRAYGYGQHSGACAAQSDF